MGIEKNISIYNKVIKVIGYKSNQLFNIQQGNKKYRALIKEE
jgi:hypothetical protein